MTLSSGTRFGSYTVTSAIGAGGMGEVYRARDSRLDRDVALKVLPAIFTTDPDRLARFRREAKVVASLNQPNIAAIFGVEEHGDTIALVLELVEGPTLADRIAQGPLPLDEALAIGRQIADALDASHEAGIIHRDLKPANVKVRPDGVVKVLDFGLAKTFTPEADANLPDSPTLSLGATRAGIILGTAAYMSPEQARGRNVDKRTDIWAFGCLLFEMLTGERPFAGDDVTDIIAAIVRAEPNWDRLPRETPAALRRLLRRALQKDVRLRLHDIADARLEIDEAGRSPIDGPLVASPAPSRNWRWTLLVATAALLAGLAVGAGIWRVTSEAPQVTQAMLPVAPAEEVGTGSVLNFLPGGSRTALAWSPTGRTLAFVGTVAGVRRIYLRDLESAGARALEGTDGARALTFSPNGESIAFSIDGELRKVRVAGGPPAKICTAVAINGISWGATRIVYTAESRLFEVSLDGGEPRALKTSGRRPSSPLLLDGERALLYTDYGRRWTSGDERVMIQRFTPDAEPNVLISDAADARYLATGHLAFLRQGTLFVVPFDVAALSVAGSEVAVLKGIAQAVSTWSGGDLSLAGQLAISPQGHLAYLSSPPPSLPPSELVVVDRRGQVTALAAPPQAYRERIESSPDGKRVAVSVQTTRNVRLLLFELASGRFTPTLVDARDREDVRPIWSHKGRVAVHNREGGVDQLTVFNPDTPDAPQVITPPAEFVPSSWSPDGERIIGSTAGDLWMYSFAGKEPQRTRLTDTPSALERFPVWSPDGRWLAYVSNASGRDDVYVQPYPGPGLAVPVSTNGGASLAWNPSGGRELFYAEIRPGVANDRAMMSVDMTAPGTPGRPTEMFAFSSANLLMATCNPTTCYSVSPDGHRFFSLRMLPRTSTRATEIQVVLNWFEALKQLAPNAR